MFEPHIKTLRLSTSARHAEVTLGTVHTQGRTEFQRSPTTTSTQPHWSLASTKFSISCHAVIAKSNFYSFKHLNNSKPFLVYTSQPQVNQVLIFKQFRTLQIYWFYFTGSNWFLMINEFWWAIVETMEKWKRNKRTSLSPQGSFSLSLLLITLEMSRTLFISCFLLTFCLFFFFFQASGFSWTKREGKSWAGNVAEEFKSGLRSNDRSVPSIPWPNSLSSLEI